MYDSLCSTVVHQTAHESKHLALQALQRERTGRLARNELDPRIDIAGGPIFPRSKRPEGSEVNATAAEATDWT
jgi:hypothetical protein